MGILVFEMRSDTRVFFPVIEIAIVLEDEEEMTKSRRGQSTWQLTYHELHSIMELL